MNPAFSFLTSHLTLKFFPSEDELQNVEMAEEDRHKKNMELKIKKRDYTGYDDDEFADRNQGLMKRSILAKYDEDLEGPQQSVRCLYYIVWVMPNCFLGIPTGVLNHVDQG